MPVTYLLTCEHAGNEIPARYKHLFKGKEEALYSHKAMDFGARQLAEKLAAELNLPLYYSSISRLLVEANRSPENEELFSEYTRSIADDAKRRILDNYYFPHRAQVEETIAKEIAVGKKVVHMAIHTFTPVLEGEVRKAEIGILFDPNRSSEKAFAGKLRTALLGQDPDLKVLYNSPYPGTADGLPAHLRKLFPDENYAGFELEVNQKFFLEGNTAVWQKTMKSITQALKSSIP